jgi:hypothetical protein
VTKQPRISIFLFFFVILLFFSSASAQNREVLPAEVLKLERDAMGMLRPIPYRSTMTGETFSARGQEANWKTIVIQETVTPDRYRQVVEDFTQGKSERRELIAVGGTYYHRFGNGPWQVLPPRQTSDIPKTETTQTITSKPKIESKAWLVETLTDNGHTVSVYEYKSTSTREVDGKSVTQMTISRFWFRDDGMLLKKFSELETLDNPRIVSNTTVYEYDNIKVEAPIIQ